MRWNYRLVRFGRQVQLQKVWYDREGVPVMRTDSVLFRGGTVEGVQRELEQALEASQAYPVIGDHKVTRTDIPGDPLVLIRGEEIS